MDNQVELELPALLDLLDLQEILDFKAELVTQDLLEAVEVLGKLDRLVLLVQKETLDHLELSVSLDLRVLQVLLVQRVSRARLVLKELLVLLEHQERRDLLAL